MPPIPKKVVPIGAPPAAKPFSLSKPAVKVAHTPWGTTEQKVEEQWCMDAASWVRQVIKWVRHPKDEPQFPETAKLVAYVYGNVAVHQMPTCVTWSVTHLPTGRAIVTSIKVQDDAYRIAEWLQRNHDFPLRKTTPAEIVAAMPDEVKDWVYCCKVSGKWLDPNDTEALAVILAERETTK